MTESEGNDPAPNVAGSSGSASEGAATGGGNASGGDGTDTPNGLLPPDQTSQTNPGAGNGSSSGVSTTTPTQPTLDGG